MNNFAFTRIIERYSKIYDLDLIVENKNPLGGLYNKEKVAKGEDPHPLSFQPKSDKKSTQPVSSNPSNKIPTEDNSINQKLEETLGEEEFNNLSIILTQQNYDKSKQNEIYKSILDKINKDKQFESNFKANLIKNSNNELIITDLTKAGILSAQPESAQSDASFSTDGKGNNVKTKIDQSPASEVALDETEQNAIKNAIVKAIKNNIVDPNKENVVFSKLNTKFTEDKNNSKLSKEQLSKENIINFIENNLKDCLTPERIAAKEKEQKEHDMKQRLAIMALIFDMPLHKIKHITPYIAKTINKPEKELIEDLYKHPEFAKIINKQSEINDIVDEIVNKIKDKEKEIGKQLLTEADKTALIEDVKKLYNKYKVYDKEKFEKGLEQSIWWKGIKGLLKGTWNLSLGAILPTPNRIRDFRNNRSRLAVAFKTLNNLSQAGHDMMKAINSGASASEVLGKLFDTLTTNEQILQDYKNYRERLENSAVNKIRINNIIAIPVDDDMLNKINERLADPNKTIDFKKYISDKVNGNYILFRVNGVGQSYYQAFAGSDSKTKYVKITALPDNQELKNKLTELGANALYITSRIEEIDDRVECLFVKAYRSKKSGMLNYDKTSSLPKFDRDLQSKLGQHGIYYIGNPKENQFSVRYLENAFIKAYNVADFNKFGNNSTKIKDLINFAALAMSDKSLSEDKAVKNMFDYIRNILAGCGQTIEEIDTNNKDTFGYEDLDDDWYKQFITDKDKNRRSTKRKLTLNNDNFKGYLQIPDENSDFAKILIAFDMKNIENYLKSDGNTQQPQQNNTSQIQ